MVLMNFMVPTASYSATKLYCLMSLLAFDKVHLASLLLLPLIIHFLFVFRLFLSLAVLFLSLAVLFRLSDSPYVCVLRIILVDGSVSLVSTIITFARLLLFSCHAVASVLFLGGDTDVSRSGLSIFKI